MKYFHVYTKGLEDKQIFRDREDFIAGMNILAVVCSSFPQLKLLAFVLMSNHVHFVLYGKEAKAKEFIDMYKNLVSRYIRGRYGDSNYLQRIATTVSEVELENDGLKRLIAYVLNNPVKAGINCVAFGYEWSSARCYFSFDGDSSSRPLSSFGSRELRSMLHSKKMLPPSWLVNSSLYIEPKSYVDYAHVEHIYGRSSSMQYFLSATLGVKRGAMESVVFSDTVIQTALVELLEKKYGVDSLGRLDCIMMRSLVRDIKVRFTSSSKQIARIVGLPINEVMRLLDS